MATTSNRREGVPAAAAPRFFKIIMDPKADSLRIPDEFSKRYGHNLPNPVFLKIPSGSIFEVELVQSNGKTMLQKGWQEFKERYSIGFGHFLVFEYNGNSIFNVLIFDTTAVEINYPLDANYEAGMDYKKVANHKDPKLEDNITESDDDSGSQCSDRVQMQRSVVKETCIAYQKALAFISAHTPHNPFFISLIQQAYVSNRFLSVPVSFAKRNLPFNSGNLIILFTDGKKWSVRCNVGNSRANLSAG